MRARAGMTAAVLVGVVCLEAGGHEMARARAQPEPDIDLVDASIEELQVDGPGYRRDRDVRVVFYTRNPLACDGERDGLIYAILVDADGLLSTGQRLAAWPTSGVDAQIVARCDGRTGQFTSPLGSVEAATGGGGRSGPHLVLTTRLSRLPADEFLWIALVTNGERYRVVPGAGQPAYWGIVERWLW